MTEDIDNNQKIKKFSPMEAFKAFNANFLNEDSCRDAIFKILHPDGASCPFCGHAITEGAALRNFFELRRCCCPICGRWFKGTTRTVLHGSHMNMRQIFALCFLLEAKLSNQAISDILKISTGAVYYWRRRLCKTFFEDETAILNEDEGHLLFDEPDISFLSEIVDKTEQENS